MLMNRKLICYIASSLDGYIAGPGDDLSFLSVVEKKGEDYGYTDFISTVDTVIIGRKTYDWIIDHAEFPYAGQKTYVITTTERTDSDNLVFYTGRLKHLVNHIKSEPGGDIFCVGGSEIIASLLKDKLIDEFIVSLIPVLIGNGTPLFRTGIPELKLELISATTYESGLVQVHYRKLS